MVAKDGKGKGLVSGLRESFANGYDFHHHALRTTTIRQTSSDRRTVGSIAVNNHGQATNSRHEYTTISPYSSRHASDIIEK